MLYIEEAPINRYNLIRWHRAEEYADIRTIEGMQPCSDFNAGCEQAVFAHAARPGDDIRFYINTFRGYSDYYESPANWTVKLMRCCEVWDTDYFITDLKAVATDGVEFPTLADAAGEIYYLKGRILLPESMVIGERFNMVIYDTVAQEVRYVSTPFRIVPPEYAKCDTVYLFAAQERFTLSINNYVPADYFPGFAVVEMRLDGKITDCRTVEEKTEYRTLGGTTRTINRTQERQCSLSTHAMDELAHEGMAVTMAFQTVTITRYTPYPQGNQYQAVDTYTPDPLEADGLSSGTVKLRLTTQVASFRTC